MKMGIIKFVLEAMIIEIFVDRKVVVHGHWGLSIQALLAIFIIANEHAREPLPTVNGITCADFFVTPYYSVNPNKTPWLHDCAPMRDAK